MLPPETRGFSTSTRFLLPLSLAIVCLPCLSESALGQSRIVTVNQHQTAENSGCNPSPPPPIPCPENVALPLEDLGAESLLGGNSYHVKTDCQVLQAKCNYKPRAMPKILSSDLKDVDPEDVQRWILELDDLHPDGQLAFEHMDTCLVHIAENSADPIGGWDTIPDHTSCPFPANVIGSREMLLWFLNSSQATESRSVLYQNGTLHRGGTNGRMFYWNGWNPGPPAGFVDSAKRLAGIGFMGAIAMGPERFDAGAFFAVLRAHNTNFLRLWLLDQWSGLATLPSQGLTPFLGSYNPGPNNSFCNDPINGCYDLGKDNPDFFSHLRKVTQSAADRGIVLQQTLFEKHGLICPGRTSQYGGSPYRDWLNQQSYLPNTIDNCTCSGASDGPWEDPLTVDCHPRDEFANDTHAIAAIHQRFLRRVGEEVGGIGNAIFEVINEAYAPIGSDPGDWGSWYQGTTLNQYWQKQMVRQMRLSLPLENTDTAKYVVRDAFNGDTDGTLLKMAPGVGKESDIDGADWVPSESNYSKVRAPSEATEVGGLGPDRLMGYATSDGAHNSMSGALAFSKPATWTKLQVRADLECVDGILRLGAKAAPGSDSDRVYVEWDCSGAGAELPYSRVRLYKKVSGQTWYIGFLPVEDVYGEHSVRLKVDKIGTSRWATAFVDGVLKSGPIALGSIADPAYAYFWGGGTGPIYPVDAGRVDNFEVAVFCDDESQGCVP
ncbi:MAG TPA: hypothetical protein VLA66_08265 [Thermoanaerobaculia bacterium]|nr:hypothetical protein [Thermoanaerobaculia bacterium]